LQLFGDKMFVTEDGGEGEYKPVTLLLIEMVDTAALQKGFSLGGIYRFSRRYVGFVETQVRQLGGVISRALGGAIVAVFGAPFSREDHARRGCEAAWEILTGLPGLFPRGDEGSPAPALQLSLVSGPALFRGAAPGVPVNYEDFDGLKDLLPAARSLGRPGKIIVERTTYELAKPFFGFRPLSTLPENQEAHELYELTRPKRQPAGIHSLRLRRISAFVGRETELSSLFDVAEKARTGHRQIVAVWGDAGIGKSRLVDEFTRRLADRMPCRTYSGYCTAYSSAPPYHPILEIVRSCCGIRTGDAQSAAKKKIRQALRQLNLPDRELAAPLYEMLAFPVDDEEHSSLRPPERKNRIFHAVARLLDELSRKRLLVITVEDLHWIDQSSEELLSYLFKEISASAILLILLFRPEYRGPLQTDPDLTSLHLDTISSGNVRELVRSIVGSSDMDPAAVRLIEEKTGGNPLFVEEFTQALVVGKGLRDTEEGTVLDESRAQQIVPASIQTVISARLDLLKPKVKSTLQVASVIGREFSHQLLQKVLGAAVPVARHLGMLRALEFIYEREPMPDAVFMFKHALTQDAAYAGLIPERRKVLHARIGTALEELYADNADQVLELLAHHYLSSENWPKARHYLRLAGEKAIRQNSFRDAYRFYRQSFALWEKGPLDDATKRQAVDTALACDWIAVFLDGPEDFKEILEEAEKIATDLADSERLGALRTSKALYSRLAREQANTADYAGQCLQRLRSSVAEIRTREELAALAPTAVAEIGVLYTMGLFLAILPITKKLLCAMEAEHCEKDYFGMALNPYLILVSLTIISMSMSGQFDEASDMYERVLPVARDINDPYSLGWLEFAQAVQKIELGEVAAAEQHLARVLEIFEETDLPSQMFWSSIFGGRGIAAGLRGDFTSALQFLEESISLGGGQSTAIFISKPLYEKSLIHLQLGELSAAEECVRSAIEWADRCGEELWLGFSTVIAGLIHFKLHPLQTAKAEALMLEGIGILNRLGGQPFLARSYLHLGEFYFDAGRTDKGIKNLRKAERMFKSMRMTYWLEKVRQILQAH